MPDYTVELGHKNGRMTKKWEEGIKGVYRRQYFYHIHNEERQRQLNNVGTAEYVAPVVQHQLPERTRVQDVLCSFPQGLSPDDVVRCHRSDVGSVLVPRGAAAQASGRHGLGELRSKESG
jgi:hypothetical protein